MNKIDTSLRQIAGSLDRIANANQYWWDSPAVVALGGAIVGAVATLVLGLFLERRRRSNLLWRYVMADLGAAFEAVEESLKTKNDDLVRDAMKKFSERTRFRCWDFVAQQPGVEFDLKFYEGARRVLVDWGEFATRTRRLHAYEGANRLQVELAELLVSGYGMWWRRIFGVSVSPAVISRAKTVKRTVALASLPR